MLKVRYLGENQDNIILPDIDLDLFLLGVVIPVLRLPYLLGDGSLDVPVDLGIPLLRLALPRVPPDSPEVLYVA